MFFPNAKRLPITTARSYCGHRRGVTQQEIFRWVNEGLTLEPGFRVGQPPRDPCVDGVGVRLQSPNTAVPWRANEERRSRRQ